MSTQDTKIPYAITEYITKHFREDFLFELKKVRKVNNHTYYTIEVSKDDFIHTLKFNEKGAVVEDETDEAFPADTHDEPGFGNLPD